LANSDFSVVFFTPSDVSFGGFFEGDVFVIKSLFESGFVGLDLSEEGLVFSGVGGVFD